MVEDDKIISEEKEVAETLSNYFANAVKSLNINILSEARSSDEGILTKIFDNGLKLAELVSVHKCDDTISKET